MDRARFRLVEVILAHSSQLRRLGDTEPVQVAQSCIIKSRAGAKAELKLRKRAASITFDKESRK
jgi:hypothetical protein